MSAPHARTADEVLHDLEVDPDRGLNDEEVRRRRERYGPNRLRAARRRGRLAILIDQFKSVVILLLAAAVVVSAALGRIVEGAAIAAALVANAAIGFFMEWQSQRSVEALRRLGEGNVRVRRGGRERVVRTPRLVPGDIVVFDAGNVIPADLRLIEANNVLCDESALTGESVPTSKSVDTVREDRPLAERTNMLYNGTAVAQGSGIGVTVATGKDTEIGRVSTLVEEAHGERTPLERRLDQLGRRLTLLTGVVAIAVTALGLIAGKSALVVIETALALAIAAVPEGLPIVATIALARGVHRMAVRQALVKRLSAVETLGAADAILTDKTGTLTENRMTVHVVVLADGPIEHDAHRDVFERDGERIVPHEHPALTALLEAGTLCNNAQLDETTTTDGGLGDPMEVALLAAARAAGLRRDALLEHAPEVTEFAFDPARKMMATVHREDARYRVAVKGAPEATLAACSRVRRGEQAAALDDRERERWLERSHELAAEGLRVLAFAETTAERPDPDPYSGLTLLGLVGFYDPPRPDAEAAVAACRRAGIRVVMVTGDHPATARRIAAMLGIAGPDDAEPVVLSEADLARDDPARRRRLSRTAVFARVSPEQKLELVRLYQSDGGVVAMTGDGINDAPALKKADIGVAMGRRGTDVARDAADMILRDDAFATIVAAIEHGRAIFANIRKFIVYLLSGNLAEILAVALVATTQAPLPLLPLQILFINFVSDVLPALALGVGSGPPDAMDEPPREPHEPIVSKAHWGAVVGYGVIVAAAVLGVFAYVLAGRGLETSHAVTVSFLTFGFARLWHVFNMRDPDSRLLANEVTVNPYVWIALAVGAVLLVGAVYIPVLSTVLGTVRLSPGDWGLVLGCSILPVLLVQPLKLGRLLWERTF